MNTKPAILLIIDPQVQNYQQLAAGIQPGVQLLILDKNRDGIEQITEYLQTAPHLLISPSPHPEVSPSPRLPLPLSLSLHIISHGIPGTLYLGKNTLQLNNLKQYAPQLMQWGITDLYIYGCEVAKGDAGTEFITKLHQLTGANIAAATTKIGNIALGGNWNLAHTIGQIKTSSVLTPAVMQDYSFVLGEFVNETFTGSDVTGNWIYSESGGTNVGLTASGGDGTPLRNLNLDTPGNGALRLTPAATDRGAFVLYNSPISSTDGVKVTFEFFQYNGSSSAWGPPGDGISFFLVNGTSSPTSPGSLGSGLGYTNLTGGYIGVGFDSFGGFGNTSTDSVAIRGSQANSNPLLQSVSVAGNGGIDAGTVPNRNSALKRAQILLTPSNAAQPNRLSVAMDFNFDGDFADAGETIIAPFDITTSNGAVPTTFKFGFAASTGASTNIHEIRNLVYETVNPTADIIDITPDPRNSGVSTITIQFSQAVTGLDVNDINLTRNGSPISLATATVNTGDNITWTLNNLSGLTATDGNYQITLNPTGSNIFSVAGGYAFTTSANDTWTVDATPPTITSITSTTTNGTYSIGTVIPISVTFSEAVTVTGTPTLTLNTGANATYASGSGTNSLTFNYTVAAGQNTADLDYNSTTALALNGGTIQDAVTNNATLTLPTPGAANSLGANKNLIIDTTAPTVSLSSAAAATINAPFSVTATFSESVTNFIATDISVTNGTVSGFSGSGTTYTFTVNPTNQGTVTVNVPAGIATDTASNSNTAATALTRTYDSVGPTVTINQAGGQTDPTPAAPINYTVTFSEPVTGFDASDISFAGSTAGGTLTPTVTGSGTTYNVAVSGISTSGTVVATIITNAATDAVGNPSVASTSTDNTVTYNTIPTLSNIAKTGNEDNNITFTAADFTNAYSDADGDSLNKIKITSLPANGTLQLSGTNVTLNQEILLANIPNLTFTPTANYNGSSSFTWNGSDGTNYATTDATANLTVNPINDAPSFSNAGNQTLSTWTNSPQTVANWANTFVFGPTADENTQTVADFLVSVTAGNDLFTTLPDIANDGTLTYTPSGKPGIATVQVQLQDDGGIVNGGVDTSTPITFDIIIPEPTVNLTVDTTTGTEAGTTAITLTATAQGAVFGNQTINLALTGTADNSDFSGTIPTQITIADGTNSAQVTLTVANDLIDEDNETATFTISNPSNGILLGTTTSQTVTITDDDTAGYDITPISGDTSEFASQATFDIKLTSQPTTTVTLNFTSSDTTEGTVIPNVTFDATNWNVPQTVTITGVDDAVADGNITYNINSTASSSDLKYNNNNPDPVTVTNTDNDIPGVTVIQSSGNTELTEAGTTDTYTIQLNTLPTGNVEITATADTQTEISLDGVNFAATQALTFTNVNGMTPQTVTVRAINDTTPEDYHSGSITHAISNSGDVNYPTTMTVGSINANITDNDISYTLTGSSTNVTEGNSGTQQITYNITRNGAISETSTVDFSFSGTATNIDDYQLVSITGTGVTTSGSSITFAPNATISTITVEVLGDQIDEDDETLIFSLVNPTATGTPSLIGSPVTTTITDDDTAGITVTPTAGLTTTETGGTSSFAVHLTSQPTANVTINLNSDKPAEGTIDKNSLTFTATNWNTPQTVTVTGVDELVDDGNIAYNIITAPATSTDAKYNGMNAADVAVTNINNDTAGITITPTSGLTTTEAGGTATFTVALTSQPTANVTINLSSDKPAEGTIDKNSLTFTATNWNTPQTVTITGVDELVDDGNIAYNIITAPATSTDAKYNGMNADDVAVTNIDNDIAGVTITQTGGNTQLTEGSITDTYTIALNTLPTGNVQITATADPQTQVSLDGVNFAASQTLTFTPTNGMTPRTVTVRAINDNTTENIHSGSITNAITTSADANYPTTIALDGITANITDNDISYSLAGGTANITEGNSGSQQLTYNITRAGALNETSTVDFNFSGTATNIADYKLVSVTGTGVTTTNSTITFAPNATSATVTLEVVGEQIDEDDESLIFSLVNPTATGTPTVIASPVTTTIIDDDTAGFTITPTSLTTTEAAGNATFMVVLNSQPTADVKLNLSSSNTAEGIIDKPTVTFSASNWNTPQTVTVTGVDDFGEDGDIAYNIITSAATSTDAKYNGINPVDVAVTNTDDDTAGFTITPTSLTTTEAAGNATFTVVLNSQPTADVKLNLSSSNTAEGIIDKPTVTFSASNWNTPQTVTVTGVDDFGDDGDIAYNIITSAVTSTDAKYNGINPVDVAVTNTDNDTAGVSLSTTNLAVYEGGAGGSYTVVLTSQPTAPVTFNFNGGSQINPLAAITFDSNNWNVPQPVNVTAIDDGIAEGLQTEIISHTVTSADGNYNGINVGTVAVSITDNDTAAAPIMQPLGRMDVMENGGEDVYELFLTTQPTANVNVAIVTDGQTTANVPYLTFTPDDWNIPQLVRVSAVDDSVVEGFHTSNITFVANSADGFYQGLPISGIVANVADNDDVGLVQSLPTPGNMMGTGADDNLVGSSGDDVINARGGNNAVDGGDGDDVLLGGTGADYIIGGAGLDQILSGPGEDYLDGGNDDDVIFAGTGSDRLYGGAGNDKLFGEQGNDYLFGGAGVDTLTGGLGRDAFAVGNGMGGMTLDLADVITDFVIGEDLIDLIPSLVFGDLSMVQNGADVVMQNVVTGEFLAVLQGVDAVSLSQVDFV